MECERKGLLLNITGDGKGKTTSALGNAVRALGWGWRVVVIQFVKSDMETGERRFFAGLNPASEFYSMGLGATWNDADADHCGAAMRAWRKAGQFLGDSTVDMLILDELNIALRRGWLPEPEVLAALSGRPRSMHVIVTGRYATEAMIAAADLVSEIRAVKHPFLDGTGAQPGIEY